MKRFTSLLKITAFTTALTLLVGCSDDLPKEEVKKNEAIPALVTDETGTEDTGSEQGVDLSVEEEGEDETGVYGDSGLPEPAEPTTIPLAEDGWETYYLYDLNQSLGENDEVLVCFSYGIMTVDEITKTIDDHSPLSESEHATTECMPMEEGSNKMEIVGDTGISNPTVMVNSSDPDNKKYRIDM